MKICIAEGCEREGRARDVCTMHYQRLRTNGHLETLNTPAGEMYAWLEAMASVSIDECRIWPFELSSEYSTYVTHSGVSKRAYYWAMVLDGRPKPAPRLEIRHLCGVHACVNPRHLEWGTHRENCADTLAHGRTTKGERSASAKLTEAQVLVIRRRRANGELNRVIAADYGVTPETISNICTGRSWRHLPLLEAS